MNKLRISVLAAATATTAGALVGGLTPAQATGGQTFYAGYNGNLVTVTVSAGAASAPTTVKTGPNAGDVFEPQSFDHGWVAGLIQNTNKNTYHGFTYHPSTDALHILKGNVQSVAVYNSGQNVVYSQEINGAYVIKKAAKDFSNASKIESSNWSPFQLAVSDDGKHIYAAALNANSFKFAVVDVKSSGVTMMTPTLSGTKSYGGVAFNGTESKLGYSRADYTGNLANSLGYLTVSSGNTTAIPYTGEPEQSLTWAGSALVSRDAGTQAWESVDVSTGTATLISGTSELIDPTFAG